MALEGTFEYECMRAELLGIEKPNYEDFMKEKAEREEAEREQLEAASSQLQEIQNESLKQCNGRLDEFSSILKSTQQTLHNITTPFSKYFKSKLFRTQTDQPSGPTEETTDLRKIVKEKASNQDNQEIMDKSQETTEDTKQTTEENVFKSDKSLIDSMIDKFDSVQTGIEVQNKQMKSATEKDKQHKDSENEKIIEIEKTHTLHKEKQDIDKIFTECQDVNKENHRNDDVTHNNEETGRKQQESGKSVEKDANLNEITSNKEHSVTKETNKASKIDDDTEEVPAALVETEDGYKVLTRIVKKGELDSIEYYEKEDAARMNKKPEKIEKDDSSVDDDDVVDDDDDDDDDDSSYKETDPEVLSFNEQIHEDVNGFDDVPRYPFRLGDKTIYPPEERAPNQDAIEMEINEKGIEYEKEQLHRFNP